MKNHTLTLIALGALFATSASASVCLQKHSQKICVGDVIHSMNYSSKGSSVIGINRYKETMTVSDRYSGERRVEKIKNVFLSSGCIDGVCIGDLVRSTDYSSQGSTITGINKITRTFIATDKYSGQRQLQKKNQFSIPQGCLAAICIGDTVHSGTKYSSRGTTVRAINKYQGTILVSDNYDGKRGNELPENLDIIKESPVYSDHVRFFNMPTVIDSNELNDVILDYNFESKALTTAENIIAIISNLENFTNSNDWINILLPAKKQAGKLSARVTGGAEFERVENTLIHLNALLKKVELYIDDNFERDALFHKAKQLLSERERVRALVKAMQVCSPDQRNLLY